MLLKHYLDQGVSKAELSRRFGVNRRTIHYWIETGQLDRELSAGAGGYAPREPVEAPVRFETPAGRQGQVDFGTFTLPWGRRHALVIVLGYSRLLWLRFCPARR